MMSLKTKLTISASIAFLILLQLYSSNFKVDLFTVVLVVLALVPWLATTVESIGVPGALLVEFQSGGKQPKQQQELITALAIYSMSAFVYKRLEKLYDCENGGLAYSFKNDDDGFKRELRWLFDNGYLEEHCDLETMQVGQTLTVKLTPIARALVKYRRELPDG